MPRTQNIALDKVIQDHNTYIKARDQQVRQYLARRILTEKTPDKSTRLLVFSSAQGDYWGCDIERLIEPLCDTPNIENLMINRIDRTGQPYTGDWDEIMENDEQTLIAYQLTQLNAATSTPTYSPLEHASQQLVHNDGQLIFLDARPPHRTLTETIDAIAAINRNESNIDTSWLSIPPHIKTPSVKQGQRQLDTFLEPAAP